MSYLIGSLPTAYIMGRIVKKIDIREHGSKNVGATNAFRVIGPVGGVSVLLIDIAKGCLAVYIARMMPVSDSSLAAIFAGFAVIAGHNWTLFLNFKGGKGVATAGGVFISLSPLATGICILVFVLMMVLFKRVSVGSIAAAITLPATIWLFNGSFKIFIFSLVISITVIIKHIPNIKRLINKTEHKFTMEKNK